MAAPEGLNMEAVQTMMRAFMDELITNQKEENAKQMQKSREEFKAELAKTNEQIQKNSEESRAEFKEFQEQLTT